MAADAQVDQTKISDVQNAIIDLKSQVEQIQSELSLQPGPPTYVITKAVEVPFGEKHRQFMKCNEGDKILLPGGHAPTVSPLILMNSQRSYSDPNLWVYSLQNMGGKGSITLALFCEDTNPGNNDVNILTSKPVWKKIDEMWAWQIYAINEPGASVTVEAYAVCKNIHPW